MWRAVRAFAQGDELVGVTLTGVAGFLVSPVSWSHHLVWVVPAVVVLLDVAAAPRSHEATPRLLRVKGRGAGATRWGVLVVVVAALIWLYDPHAEPRPDLLLDVLQHDTLVLAALALVVVLPIRVSTPDPVPRSVAPADR
jgi:alpha-1,2-mannosyltransferase